MKERNNLNYIVIIMIFGIFIESSIDKHNKTIRYNRLNK
jgi:hypothetical protein